MLREVVLAYFEIHFEHLLENEGRHGHQIQNSCPADRDSILGLQE
jgi:hypothetical protein